jgi:hypothetical protein
MAHGTSKGVVDPKFEARIKELETKAEKMATQFRTYSTYREWHVPEKVEDPMHVPSLHVDTWERNNINIKYSSDILAGPGKKGGTCGDLIAMKWQADFMAEEERAFRTRHASFVRCAAIAHGRLNGHGKSGKSIFSFLKDAVQTHIDAGAQTGGE